MMYNCSTAESAACSSPDAVTFRTRAMVHVCLFERVAQRPGRFLGEPKADLRASILFECRDF